MRKIIGYRAETVTTPGALQDLLNQMTAEGFTIRDVIHLGGFSAYTVTGYRDEEARHEFRPRQDGGPCMFCHFDGPAPWHTNPPGRFPHPFKYADPKRPDYIACAVCGLFPEHPLHAASASSEPAAVAEQRPVSFTLAEDEEGGVNES